MAKHGYFHWNELMTRDVEGAKAFYSETLGWTYSEMPMPDGGTYYIAQSGEQMVGGMFQISDDDPQFAQMPNGWMAYIAVDDIKARVAKATANGGTQLGDMITMPGTGTIAMVKQPDGVVIGWMQPEEGAD